MLLTEGWDCPAVDCVLVLRPTRNRALYQQMIGRGTRTAPGKRDLLLLDFMWLSRRFDPCRPWELLTEDPRLAGEIRKLAAMGYCGDLAALAEQARRNLGAEDDGDSEPDRESVLNERRRAMLRAFREGRAANGHRFIGLVAAGGRPRARSAGDLPMTARQRDCLARNGIDPGSVEGRRAAAQIIGAIAERASAGLASVRQLRCLSRHGYEDPSALTFEDAKRLIDELARNGWRRPAA